MTLAEYKKLCHARYDRACDRKQPEREIERIVYQTYQTAQEKGFTGTMREWYWEIKIHQAHRSRKRENPINLCQE